METSPLLFPEISRTFPDSLPTLIIFPAKKFMPARVLSLPFIVLVLVFLYLAWEADQGYSMYIIPVVVILALIYVLAPQINWWWYRRYPPALDPPVRALLERHYRFYQHLSPVRQKQFRERVALYQLSVDFKPQGMESTPEDLKMVVAAAAVTMTLHIAEEKAWRLPAFEHVVLYPHRFPSPQYPEHFHASEIFEEDGVLLFSAEHLMLAFTQPAQYFNLGLYEYARVFKKQYLALTWPPTPVDIWEKLEPIGGFSRAAIGEWINLPLQELDAEAVAVAHFFLYPRAFQLALPDLFDAYEQIFQTRFVA